MKIPDVKNWGGSNVESYAEYRKRWPVQEFKNFPETLIKEWVYRHWPDFEEYWLPIGALDWNYEHRHFSNDEIMRISHHGDWLDTLDYWGSELFKDKMRRETWLAQHMLERGTTPSPILVFENGEQLIHPRGLPKETFCTPYQLIEGHMRTAYLRGMINEGYVTLKTSHIVIVAN